MPEKIIPNQVCKNVYIASCTETGGIYRYTLYNDGTLKFEEKTPANGVMYLTIENDTLYAVLKAPFPASVESGLCSYTIHASGSLIPNNDTVSTKGEVACHLAVSIPEHQIYCANYTSGSVFKSDGTVAHHSGHGPHEIRQTAPHTHCTVFTPDKKYLCVADLGIDKILVYDKALNPVSECSLLPGSGPRHLIFSPDGVIAYCVNELSNTVSVMEYSDGKLSYVESFSMLPGDFIGESSAAAIRISADGNYLYASNRGHDSIACFQAEEKELILMDIVPCGGSFPRDFNITPDGKWIICTNETGNNVTVFQVGQKGQLTRVPGQLELEAPLCVIFGQ